MTVASLELSRELYELSHWQGEGSWIETSSGLIAASWQEPLEGDTKLCPAYDLGYLLRQLPVYAPKGFELEADKIRHLILHPSDGGRWTAYYTRTVFLEEADTPEDAACLLAIELFKQKILT